MNGRIVDPYEQSRRNVLVAAMRLSDGIATVRRRLARARGEDPKSSNMNTVWTLSSCGSPKVVRVR